jgi:glycosyltransferase involved in cell wall biosynthesis
MVEVQEKPKVLFLNSCINGGGAGRSLVAFLKHAYQDIDPVVVMPEPGVMASELCEMSRIIYVPEFVERIHHGPYKWVHNLGWAWLDFASAVYATACSMSKIVEVAKQEKPDLIYCNHMLAKPVGAWVGSQLKIPVVFHARNVHVHGVGRRFYSFLGRREWTKRIICNSQASAKEFQMFSAPKVEVVSNAVDLERFDRNEIAGRLRYEFDLPVDAQVVGYLGRILPKKGIDILLQAFRHIRSRFPKAVLALVGDNDGGLHTNLRAEYEEKIRAWGMEGQVLFVGFKEDIRPYLVDFDCLVLPSIEPESFGRTLIEAMALGIPAVATRLGGTVEVIQDGKSGLIVEPGDSLELAGALSLLLSEPHLRREMGKAGRESVENSFSAKRQAEKITRILYDVAEREGKTFTNEIVRVPYEFDPKSLRQPMPAGVVPSLELHQG